MPAVTKIGMAGDSLTDVAGTAGVKHWSQIAQAYYASLFPTLDADLRPYNCAVAGSTAFLSAASWRGPLPYGDQIFNTIGPLQVGLGKLLALGRLDTAVIGIGANDYSKVYDPYNGIYNGTWTQSQIDAHKVGIRAAIWDGVADLQSYGDVNILVWDVPCYNFALDIQATYPDGSKRQRVEEVVESMNAELATEAAALDIPLLRMHALYDFVYGDHRNPTPTIRIGGNTIYLQQGGDGPQNAFQADGIHPQTIWSAVMFREIAEALNTHFDADIDVPDESTMCGWAGLPTHGGDTSGIPWGTFSQPAGSTTMATDLETLQTIRSSILTEIAACVSKKNYAIDGQSVDWDKHRDSLFKQLEQIDAQIAAVDGPYEMAVRGVT